MFSGDLRKKINSKMKTFALLAVFCLLLGPVISSEEVAAKTQEQPAADPVAEVPVVEKEPKPEADKPVVQDEPVKTGEPVAVVEEKKAEQPAAEEKSEAVSQVKPEETVARQSNGASAHLAPSNRQSGGNQFLGNLLQPLNPGNFLSNLLPGRNSERRQIGETCQYSSDCLAGTDNSVCFNGTCLCNLGYRYTADSKTCTPVDTCPTCSADTCSSGTDVYCNGTCIRNMKAITIKGLGENSKMMLTSPNWPERYPAGTDVYYCVTASAGRRVNIRFDWMDLETNCGYNCDYVRVYNGCVGKPSELIAMFHGDNARSRECVTSTCNQMLVHFHTDPSKGGPNDERSGFMGFIREATYTNDLCNKCGGKS